MDTYEIQGMVIPVSRKEKLNMYAAYMKYLIIKATLQGYFVEKSRFTRSRVWLKSEQELVNLLRYYEGHGCEQHHLLLRIV